MKKVKSVSARTPNQKIYIQAINEHDITFCCGPAGSGKTHISVAMAAWSLAKEKIEKIILCRPVVAVGQDIGFLPGTADDKVGPYCRPLFDELGYYFSFDDINKMMLTKQIEIAPLSMMRGRTLRDCFVIMDEAQNATEEELEMFLTRIGSNCKMIITGDTTQSDLSDRALEFMTNALGHIPRIGFVYLAHEDIVRHSLIREIITAINSARSTPKAKNDYAGY